MRRGRWFLPESPDVVALLAKQSSLAIEGADALVAWAEGAPGGATALVEIEHRGDTAKRELLEELREAFVIPLEPEDVFALSRGIDWVLDYSRDLVSEAEAMKCEPDEGIAEMARILAEGTRHLGDAIAALAEPGDRATAAADAAIRSERDLEHVYYRGMARLLDVEERHERISLRELYRACDRIGDALRDVAERVVYAVVKQS